MKKNFSETLKELRQAAGYTQKQVYEIIGVPQSTFSSWEIGKAEPSADILLQLFDIYEVSDVLASFGYGRHNDESFTPFNKSEQNIIGKYRHLDSHGRLMVDFTLEKEYDRSISMGQGYMNQLNEPLEVNAAHARTDIDIPDDVDTSENDIMDDENF